MNRKLYLLVAIIMIVSTLFTACSGAGESKYPERAINLIVPFGAGGGTDGWNRAIAAALEDEMDWTVKVSNVTGGSAGSTGTAKVWTSEHDGYTIAGTSETPLTIPVMTGDKQTAKDWEYFIAGGSPGVLCVNKDAGIKDLQDLIDQTTAAPDEIKIAGTSGGLWFLLANLLGSYGDVPLGVVTYDGSAAARDACVKGETAAVAASAGEVAEYIKSGDLVAIAAFQTTDFTHPDFGTVPAITSLVPAVEAYLPLNQFIGFMVPQDTPDDVKGVLKDAFMKACDSETLKKFAEENYAVFYKLTGKEAQDMCIKTQAVMSWMLYDMGKTEFSPEEFGIERPSAAAKEEKPAEPESNFPERAINLIVPFGAGGGTDGWNRAIAAALEEEMDWTVKVSNVTGGSAGSTGTAKVWNSDHDGYTIAGTSETPLTIPVMTGDKQIAKDWEYFIAGGSPGVLCVNKDAGYADFQALIDAAKADPDKVKIAGTSGGLWFLLANLLGTYGDVPLGVVTYDGSAAARDACVKGETAAVAASAGEVAEYVKSGDLIPVAAFQTTDFTHADFGTVPAVTSLAPAVEAYLPLNQFIGFMVPQDTPDDVKAVLQDAFLKACDGDVLKQFAEENYAVFYKLTGAEAQEMCAKTQGVMSWMLYNMGKTEYSPADFGIPEP